VFPVPADLGETNTSKFVIEWYVICDDKHGGLLV